MIDTIDQQLKEWVISTAAGSDVQLSMPPAKVDRPTVFLHLYEMDNAAPSRRDGPRPIQLTLRYLITTRAATPIEAHRLLSELYFAALENPEFDVDVRPIPIESWRVFDLLPQPAFTVCMQLVKERPNRAALITKPVRARVSPLSSMKGIVLGPSGVPIAQARVEVPGTRQVAYTDQRGQFRFRTVPAFVDKKELRVVARGFEQTVSEPFSAERPIVIRFQPQEN